MNTMLRNNGNLFMQVMKFANDVKRSGKNPKAMLDDAIASGKYTKEQIENARKMAEKFASLLK